MPTLLDEMEGTAEQLAAVDWAGQPGLGAALEQLVRVERFIAKTKLSLLGAFDSSGEYRSDLHPSAATWLGDKAHADTKRVRHELAVARKLRHLPVVEQAQAEGRIGFEHVAVLTRAWCPKVAEAFAEAETELVAAAEALDFDTFTRAVRAWRDFVDPDERDQRTQENEQRRDAHGSWTWDDLFRLDAWLDALGGTEFKAEWDRLEQMLFEQDWAEARARLGDKACAADLRRTAGQRRADALVEMARRSATLAGPSEPARWVLNLMVGWRTYCAETVQATHDEGRPAESESEPDPESNSESDAEHSEPTDTTNCPPPWWPTPDPMGEYFDTMCELENFRTIAPSRALSPDLASKIRRVVFGPDGHIIDFGQTRDYPSPALREAIYIRDRQCTDPGCTVPGRHCQVDHIEPRSRGGPTSERNLELKCGGSNRLKGARLPEAS